MLWQECGSNSFNDTLEQWRTHPKSTYHTSIKVSHLDLRMYFVGEIKLLGYQSIGAKMKLYWVNMQWPNISNIIDIILRNAKNVSFSIIRFPYLYLDRLLIPYDQHQLQQKTWHVLGAINASKSHTFTFMIGFKDIFIDSKYRSE